MGKKNQNIFLAIPERRLPKPQAEVVQVERNVQEKTGHFNSW